MRTRYFALALLVVSGAARVSAQDAACVEDGRGYCAGSVGAEGGHWGPMGLWRTYWGPEPQTCYAPRFGCYPGNNRHMHRHTAFHGYYYRRPYNYRQTFDYPWHAALHEPTSFFSYNVDPAVDSHELLPPQPPAEGPGHHE